MTNQGQRQPFYNKIFFCDIIGYSRLDALGQFACQRNLNAAVTQVLGRLGARLEDDVIALPTGDGLVLNFLDASPPDVHLRTALMLLEALHYLAEHEENGFGLRIGLNSFVDTWVRDINGKRNVVGSGINMAQRVMDIGQHGQVLMHDKVHTDLKNYPDHSEKLVRIGEFMVKHGKVLKVSQYVDPGLQYLTSDLVEQRPLSGPAAFNFDDMLKSRVTEEVLRLSLDRRAYENMSIVREFIEDFLDRKETLQDRKIWVTWIASELVENAFQYNPAAPAHGVELVIAKTRQDLLISVAQPPVEGFNLSRILSDGDKSGSFMQMMVDRGLKWRVSPGGGKLVLELELPDSISPTSNQAGGQIGGGTNWNDLPEPVREFAEAGQVRGSNPGMVFHKGVGLCRPSFEAEGIVESNYEAFQNWLLSSMEELPSDVRTLVLDLSQVAYISSRGLRCLTYGRQVATRHDLELVIVIGNSRLSEVFQISRYDRIFRVFPDVPTAFAMVRSL